LGVVPQAVADIHNYNLWVQDPRLPDSVIDVGQRTEPNLELLQQLNPSLDPAFQRLRPFSAQKLQPIGPTMEFGFNDGSGKPLTVGRNSLLQLAQRLGLEARATQHLQQFDAFLLAARSRLAGVSGSSRCCCFRCSIPRHVLVIGQKSLFQQVMDQLGIENAWQGETNFWGTCGGGNRTPGGGEKCARAIYLDHGNQAMMDKVSSRRRCGRRFPFIRQGQLRQVPAVWFYGATLSAMRFCRLLEQAQEARS
jgi:ABC-type Fe3+-hydroxamate transport system substrate-binding protein